MGETVKESLWSCRWVGYFEGFQSSAPPCTVASLPAPSPADSSGRPHAPVCAGEFLAPASNAGSRLCRGLLLPVSHSSWLLFVYYWHLLRNVHQGAGHSKTLGKPTEGTMSRSSLLLFLIFLFTFHGGKKGIEGRVLLLHYIPSTISISSG